MKKQEKKERVKFVLVYLLNPLKKFEYLVKMWNRMLQQEMSHCSEYISA